jgi:hypothetical protein
MIDILYDTVIDALKILPFLFFTFLLIELFEHKMNEKTNRIIKKSGKYGPIIGSSLGIIPQCGFSVAATNLYVTKIISLGTLIAIYLSTSDEMLPILISTKINLKIIISILIIKWIIGIVVGIIIDLATKKVQSHEEKYELCIHDHCHCEKESIFLSALKHTMSTIIFVMIATFFVNFLFEYYGEEALSKLFLKNSILGPFLASLIGLIPSCAASVMLTELYLEGAIKLSSCIAGLLTSSGTAFLVLFKSNKNIKENIAILAIVYISGVLSGLLIEGITLFL